MSEEYFFFYGTKQFHKQNYTIETETEVPRVSINRPHCIDMTDAYIKITDFNGSTTYQLTRICSGMATKLMYTYEIHKVGPQIV